MTENEKAEKLKKFIQFQKNLKRTSLGFKFGNLLFTRPDKITPKIARQALVSLGLDLSDDMELGLDAVQAIVSGSVAIDAYQTGKNLKSIVNPGAESLKLLTAIAVDQGLIDSNSATFLRVGTNVAQIFASGGANVTAWVGLAMELGQSVAKAEIEAKQIAMKQAVSWYKGKISEESQNFSMAIQKLQAGEVGVFGFLSLAATKGSLIYESAILKNPQLERIKQILPGLEFIPVGNGYVKGEGSSSTWYGETKSSNFVLPFRALASGKFDMSETEAARFIIEHAILPYVYGYNEAEYFFRDFQKRESIFKTALLLGVDQNLQFSENMGDILQRHMLTPSDLGMDLVKNLPPIQKRAMFVTSEAVKFGKDFSHEQVLQFDAKGESSLLFSDPDMKKSVSKNLSYPWLEFEKKPGILQGPANWRRASNLLAVMDMIELVVKDPFYQKLGSGILENYTSIFPQIEEFKQKLSDVASISTIRKVNTLALGNVAHFLKRDPKKVVLLESEVGKPSIFKGV